MINKKDTFSDYNERCLLLYLNFVKKMTIVVIGNILCYTLTIILLNIS